MTIATVAVIHSVADPVAATSGETITGTRFDTIHGGKGANQVSRVNVCGLNVDVDVDVVA